MTKSDSRRFAERVDAAGLLGGTRFLHSGEFHYFRVPRAQWRARLDQMRDIGLNGVSIYIPWNWHQPDAETLDLIGATLPERDLIGCLTEIAAAGLACVFRPGPFITAEWHGGGIPDWLLEAHPEILACDAWGEPTGRTNGYPAITYAHPAYESAARHWMLTALGAAKPYLAANGGPIINVQLDDESSYWNTLLDPLRSDYSPFLVMPDDDGPSRYARWLLDRHGDLAAVNAAHRTEHASARQIEPPRVALADETELTRYLDWHDFKIANINEHCALLYEVTRDAGVVEPISMLFPYLLSVQARQFSRFWAERGLGDIWLTNECYLALFDSAAVSEHKLGSIVTTHDTYHMWRQGTAGPPITMEIQGSNASWLTPGSMEMLYSTSIARGIRGLSYFMMVGGANPPGYENNLGTAYDISAPISPDGRERPHAGVIRKLARIVDTAESALFTASPSHDVWCGYYLPYESTAIAGASGGMRGAGELVHDVFFGGEMGLATSAAVQTLMTLSGVTQGSLDLETVTDEELAAVGQLWVMSMDFISEQVQRRLVRYARGGGHLVMLPGLPRRDESGAPCTLLLDAVLPGDDQPDFPAIQESGSTTFSILRATGGQVLVAPGGVARLPDDGRGTVLARLRETDAPCAVTYPLGDGTVTVLGFRLTYRATEETDHQDFLVSLVEGAVGPRTAWAANPQLTAMQLTGPEGGFVCLVNPTQLPASSRVHWTPDETATGVRAVFPALIDGIALETQGARLLPVRRRLRSGYQLEYATWELLAERDIEGGSALVFATPGGGTGELCVTGDAAAVSFDGAAGDSGDSGDGAREGSVHGALERTEITAAGLVAVVRSAAAEITVRVTGSIQ